MAAYAALVSLMNTVDAIQNHHRLFTSLDKDQTQSLKERLDSLLQFVEDYDFRGGMAKEAVEDLKSQIGSAAHAAEVVIEGHIADRVMSEYPLRLLQQKIKFVEFLMPFFQRRSTHKDAYISKRAVEDLKTRIESAAHAADVISDSQRIRLRDSTQAITKEAVEDLRIRFGDVGWFFEGTFNRLIRTEESSDEEQSDDLQNIIEDMGSLLEKVNYVKEQLEHYYGEQSLDLQKIMDDMGSLLERVNSVKEQMEHEYQKPIDSMPTAASSRSYSAGGNTSMVGFDGYMHELKDRLTGDPPDWQVIPIIGMGGIGKTALARNVYDDSLIVQHFDRRAWATVSQEYSVRKILVETLSSIRGSTDGLNEKSEDKLGEELYKILFGRRYLIILDDVWSKDDWERVQSFFPQEKGSRIIATTRHSDMAEYFGTSALNLSFLGVDESWELFCKKVFARKFCPPELEGIGRKIVKKCGGLPLSVVVIGGVLGKSSRVQEYWENVEKDMSSIVNSAEENLCSDILSLSYNRLPAHLKPCFLYLGTYSEDTLIRMTELVGRWVAEGFLKPNKDQSFEEVGEAYVKDLEERNLIVVQQAFRYYGKTYKFCKVHDLLRELCIKIAEEEKFFCVMSRLDNSRHIDREGCSVFQKIIQQDQDNPQVLSLSVRGETKHQSCELWRVLINGDIGKSTCERVSLRFWEQDFLAHKRRPLCERVHSLSVGETQNRNSELWSKIDDHFDVTKPTREQVSLRCETYEALKPFIMWNLQTFMCHSWAPLDIWEMTHLRHVKARYVVLPGRPSDNHIVLENLHTLETVRNFKCCEEACKRMPNIKKLSIEYNPYYFEDEAISCLTLLSNVGRFNKLESLKYNFRFTPNRDELLPNLKFPNSLRELKLVGCKLHWDDLTIIGSLPHLEALKLGDRAVRGPKWNPIENQFRHLKFLKVNIKNLINWKADSSHFPNLEKLILSWGRKRLEIPEGIGEIPTLRVIYVLACSASVAISALKILKLQQEEYANNDINVFVDGWKSAIGVRKWMESECITTDNVHFF